MGAEISDGAVAVGDSIAIDAAVGTGVVGADVARQDAAAAGPVAAFPRRDRVAGDVGKAAGIDAAGLAEAGAGESGLGAERRGDAVVGGDLGEPRQLRPLFVRRRVAASGGAAEEVLSAP